MNLKKVVLNKVDEIGEIQMGLTKKAIKEMTDKIVKGNIPEYVIMPTGLRPLDNALGGGIVLGGNIHCWGKEGAGKTVLASYLARLFQESGRTVYWDDLEGNLNPEWLTKMGVCVDELSHPVECYTAEEHTDMILLILIQKMYDLCIVDSIDNLSPERQVDKMSGDARGGAAALMSRITPQVNMYRKSWQYKGEVSPTLFWVSQVRVDQNTGGFSYQGGRSIKHLWTQSIRLNHVEYFDNSFTELTKPERHKASFMKIHGVVERTRITSNFKPFELWFDLKNARFDTNLMLVGEKKHLISAGAWYYIGEKSFQGGQALKKALDESPELVLELEQITEPQRKGKENENTEKAKKGKKQQE